jgi:Spore germination protein
MRKKSIWTIAIIAVIVVTAVIVSVSFISAQQDVATSQNANSQTFSIYFLNKTKDTLTSEKRQISASGNNIYQNLLNELIKGPQDKDNNLRAIPQGVKVLSVSTDSSNTTTVDFSEEFNQKNASDTLLAAYTVAKTLTQLPNTQQVFVKVKGKPIVDNTGKAEGAIADEDIVVGTGANQDKEVYVSLYFYNSDATYLEKETRKVNAASNETLEKYVIEELIKGPSQKGLAATLSADSKLISVQTKDGICFVNFSSDFVSKNTGGSTKEMGAIYSIVDSLTELDDVKKVQFLIEGKKLDSFGSFAFNEPFDRKDDIIDSK